MLPKQVAVGSSPITRSRKAYGIKETGHLIAVAVAVCTGNASLLLPFDVVKPLSRSAMDHILANRSGDALDEMTDPAAAHVRASRFGGGSRCGEGIAELHQVRN